MPQIVSSLPCLLSQGAEAGLKEEGQVVDTSCEEVVQGCCCIGSEGSRATDEIQGTRASSPMEGEGEEGIRDLSL